MGANRPAHSGTPAAEPVQRFGTAEAARILGISPARVRAIVKAGLCQPSLTGRSLQFRFQDLLLLRTAHGLLQTAVAPRQVRRALAALAKQLPPERPLSGVRIYAAGRQVVAADGRGVWRPESGQVVFSFAVDELARKAGVVVPVQRARDRRRAPKHDRHQEALCWFERGLTLEQNDDPAGARAAYERALEGDPELADAHVNLGRLLHEDGDAAAAAAQYRHALACDPEDPVAHYNLALALEDVADWAAAVTQYREAIKCDPDFADAHFNLGTLLEKLGRRAEAIRHLRTYRTLIK